MVEKNPHRIVKFRYITEKSKVLENLQHASSSASLKKYDKPKYVFVVDPKANKQEIAWAIENIYSSKNVKVDSVNTIRKKPKKRRVRGHLGKTKLIKKAIVTFSSGEPLDEQV